MFTLGVQVQFILGFNVNTPFSKYSHQKSGTVPVPREKVSTLYSGTKWLEYTVSERNTLFAGSQAPVLGRQELTQPYLINHLRFGAS